MKIIVTIIIIMAFGLALIACERKKESASTSIEYVERTDRRLVVEKFCLEGIYYWVGHFKMAPAYNSRGFVQGCTKR